MNKTVAVLLLTSMALYLPAASAQAQLTEKVLYAFTGGADGGYPYSGLVSDAVGNLYGTTLSGGSTNCYLGCGVVFELSPASGGGWTETVLHTFTGGSDGAHPIGGLILDSVGNLYGTTSVGGLATTCVPAGDCGTVFELTPTSGGGWTETVLYGFKGGGSDGNGPQASLVFDKAGNLYGTTVGGGGTNCLGEGCGTIFRLTPTSSGGWKESVLHAFTGGNDGGHPLSAMVFDAAGNLYGTAYQGGASAVCYSGCGVVFKLTPATVGWRESVIHTFTGGNDGSTPWYSGVIFDPAGTLYGTANNVFRLTKGSSGGWIEGTIHNFTSLLDGQEPRGGLIFDASGNLYGTTWLTNNDIGAGTAFELTLTSKGWRESALYRFTGGSDGGYPEAGLMVDSLGNLYGTTSGGGSVNSVCQAGCGVVYELSPASSEAH